MTTREPRESTADSRLALRRPGTCARRTRGQDVHPTLADVTAWQPRRRDGGTVETLHIVVGHLLGIVIFCAELAFAGWLGILIMRGIERISRRR